MFLLSLILSCPPLLLKMKRSVYLFTYTHTCLHMYTSKPVMLGVKNNREKPQSCCVAWSHSPPEL